MRKNNIEPKKVRFIYPKYGEEANGLLIEGSKNGITTLIENPAIRIYEKYEKIYVRMITELGLSPSARSKMALTQSQAKEKEEDPLLRILRGEDIDDDVI